jgi:septal ring-binding cell division protein DamX
LPTIRTVLHLLCAIGLFFIVWPSAAQSVDDKRDIVIVDQGTEKNNAQLFHQGLQAYLKEDYATAADSWLESTKSGHAKSAFNIGIMWQQGQIPGQQVNLEQARKYFIQSARSGYAPAQSYLDERNQTANTALQPDEEREPIAVKPVGSKVKATEIKNEAPKILVKKTTNQVRNYWSIQIFASKDLSHVKKMVEENDVNDKTIILTEKVNGATWYKLVYGQYDSHKDASTARDNLPKALKVGKPWVRMVKK